MYILFNWIFYTFENCIVFVGPIRIKNISYIFHKDANTPTDTNYLLNNTFVPDIINGTLDDYTVCEIDNIPSTKDLLRLWNLEHLIERFESK